MRHPLILITGLCVFVTSGCSQSHIAKMTTQESTVRQGERDANGKLMLHVFDVRGRRVPVPLYTDHGFMLFNVGTLARPVPRFELASASVSRVMLFSTLQEFTNALARLPSPSTLHHYDKCSAPTSYGLDTNILHTIERFCATRRIKVAEAPFVTCTCPN